MQVLSAEAALPLSTPLLRIVGGYGYEIRPQDLIGRVTIAFNNGKPHREYFFFIPEKILNFFQKLLASDQDVEIAKGAINLFAQTTFHIPVAPQKGFTQWGIFKTINRVEGDNNCSFGLEDLCSSMANKQIQYGHECREAPLMAQIQQFLDGIQVPMGMGEVELNSNELVPFQQISPAGSTKDLVIVSDNAPQQAQPEAQKQEPLKPVDAVVQNPTPAPQPAQPVAAVDPAEFGPEIIIEAAQAAPQAQATETEWCLTRWLRAILCCLPRLFCWLCDCYADEEQADPAQV
jgi:hypothetical protein